LSENPISHYFYGVASDWLNQCVASRNRSDDTCDIRAFFCFQECSLPMDTHPDGGEMEATKISATNLRSQTRDIIERVRFRGEHFIVQTFGKPVAVIIGIEEYKTLLGYMAVARNNVDESIARVDPQVRSDL
jgi:prevent-host-death family protein